MNHTDHNAIDGADLWDRYDALLASYAQKSSASLGRIHPHTPNPLRLPYQRDRERIIYSSAFRRLRGKMQVVSPSTSDYVRNRMFHSLEVASVARGIARELGLNEDLVEVIALAHDIGHPPFAHAGERALDRKMREHGRRFTHNEQAVRIVTVYEKRYRQFEGLNLSIEVLNGLNKHNVEFFVAGRTVRWPHMEMQVVDMADEIAYLSADTEDALRGGYISAADVRAMPVLAEIFARYDVTAGDVDVKYVSRFIVKYFVRRFLEATRARIAAEDIRTLRDVQDAPMAIADFDRETRAAFSALKAYLFDVYYLSDRVKVEIAEGEQMISDVFDDLLAHPEKISANFNPSVTDPLERVCDFIAGMTDGYLREMWEDSRG